MANAIMLKGGLALPSNIGVVDLGDIDWGYDADIPRFRSNNFDMGKIKSVASYVTPNILHILQETYTCTSLTAFNSGMDKAVALFFSSDPVHEHGGWIQIRDTQYTAASEFKQAVKGLLMFYEKSEEI